MSNTETQKELHEKILNGLKEVYKNLIEYKKYKKTDLVVMREGKIVYINPEECSSENNEVSEDNCKEDN